MTSATLAGKKNSNGSAPVNFGDLSLYVAGGGLPEGNYALTFMAQMYQAVSQDGVAKGPARLGIMVSAHSLTDPTAEPRQQFYSMGSKAHESFAPDPDTGKSLVSVAGGSGGKTLNNQTNWAFFIKSLYDSSLPVGIFTNDLSVLDGIHVHMANVPEPEDRRGFQSTKTSEVAEEPRRIGTIAVVTEILEGGAPWEGGGGIPEATAPVAAPKLNGKIVAKTAAPVNGSGKVVAKTVAKPAPAVAVADSLNEGELMDAAVAAVTAVLEKNPAGASSLLLRTGAFKAATELFGDEVAQQVIDVFFGSDEALETVVGQLGYTVKAKKVVPAA